MDIVVIISIFIAALAAGASLWAAWEARMSAKATQDAAEASLVISFFDQYFEPNMAESIRILSFWKLEKGDDFANLWIKGLKIGDADARNVDNARRRLKGYFHKATRLYFAGVIRLETIRELINVAGINIYYDVVDPLELVLNPDRSARTIDFLKKKFGRYSKAENVEPIPPDSHCVIKNLPKIV